MRLITKIISSFITVVIPFYFLGCATANIASGGGQSSGTSEELEIHFIDVGDGDSTLIHISNDENVLIDAGSPSGGPEVVRYLKNLGVKKISHFIFTHPHDDHIGGVFSVLSEFEVDHYYDNGFSNFKSAVYGDYIKLVRAKLSRYSILQAGEELSVGGLKLDVLNPLLPPVGNINEDSIVLKVIYGDVSILLSGDMGRIGERRLMSSGTILKSRIIKIAHHGENDVCSEDFLEGVAPDAAIISVSKINKYARPHPELISRLERAGIKIHRTGQSGSIVVKTNGKTYLLSTAK